VRGLCRRCLFGAELQVNATGHHNHSIKWSGQLAGVEGKVAVMRLSAVSLFEHRLEEKKCRRSSSREASLCAAPESCSNPAELHAVSPDPGRQPEGPTALSAVNMSKVNGGSSGCRAVVMAGRYLSCPSAPALTRSSGQRQRRVLGAQRRVISSDDARERGKAAAPAQQEQLGYCSAAVTSRNLIHRDVKAFLNEVGGDPREARYWLAQFQRANSTRSPAFAVLEVDGSVFNSREMVQSLAFGLSFLQRMDMKPVVVMGWSEQEETGPKEPVAGSRCTQGVVGRSQQLTEALQQHSATVLPLFSAESFLLLNEAPRGSSPPTSIAVDTGLLQWSLDCGTIPLVCPIGRDGRGCSVMLDPTEVTAAISRALQPHKVMFLNNSGGVLCTVSLPSDLPSLSVAAWLSTAERRKVTTIARLLNQLPSESSAVITSADTVLTELFSHRGSGTLFKNGDPIHWYNSLDGIDVERLLALINKSFDKTLRADYIDSLKGRLHSVYLSEGYSVAAIITMEPVNSGTPYLDKFVVSSSKQGQGTSHILWECIRQDLGKLFWRSRATNRINPWYFKHCDGSFVNGVWTVFWFGLTDIRDSYELTLDRLCSFYSYPKERILTGCITTWYSSCTALNRKALQRVVKAAQHITRTELPSMEDLYIPAGVGRRPTGSSKTQTNPATDCSTCCYLACTCTLTDISANLLKSIYVGLIIVRYEAHYGGVVCKLHDGVCGVDGRTVTGEESEEGWAEHAALWCACALDQCRGCVVPDSHHLKACCRPWFPLREEHLLTGVAGVSQDGPGGGSFQYSSPGVLLWAVSLPVSSDDEESEVAPLLFSDDEEGEINASLFSDEEEGEVFPPLFSDDEEDEFPQERLRQGKRPAFPVTFPVAPPGGVRAGAMVPGLGAPVNNKGVHQCTWHQDTLGRKSTIECRSVTSSTPTSGRASLVTVRDAQLTGTDRPRQAAAIARTVLEAKTRVWEEFGEAMEEDYRSASQRDSGNPVLSAPQKGEAVLCQHCLQCGWGAVDLNWGHCQDGGRNTLRISSIPPTCLPMRKQRLGTLTHHPSRRKVSRQGTGEENLAAIDSRPSDSGGTMRFCRPGHVEHWTSSIPSAGCLRVYGSLPNQSTCALWIWRRHLTVSLVVFCGECSAEYGGSQGAFAKGCSVSVQLEQELGSHCRQQCIARGRKGVWFGNHRISSLLFADDVVLLASSSQDLQHVLERFAAECEAAGMRISTSKSEAMVLDRKRVACPLQVGGEVLYNIYEVFLYKLLRHYFCNGETVLMLESNSLVILNEVLAKVSYSSTVYHIHTGDLASFQFESHEAVFPITIKQPQLPVLYDMGTDISSQVTITTKTFLRYTQIKELLKSIRRFYSNIKVIIADDSFEPEHITEEYVQHYIMHASSSDCTRASPMHRPLQITPQMFDQIQVVRDSCDGCFLSQGWFAGRNLAVSQVTTKYFLWVDDDFVFTEETKIEKLVEVMEAVPELDVLGGSVQGNQFYFSLLYEEGEEMDGGCLHRKSKGKFHSLPGYPQCSVVSGVVNFFLARTDAALRVGFDPKLQRVAHSEFFMDGLGSLLVASCDHVTIGHQPKTGQDEDAARYAKFRHSLKSDVEFKLQLHFFKNHLKCVRYG
ncbi:hypothetical protein L3Q82_014551, partial [Scortum barcoo]